MTCSSICFTSDENSVWINNAYKILVFFAVLIDIIISILSIELNFDNDLELSRNCLVIDFKAVLCS